jgi:Phytanoyl-CoA dioxygenase (PhyH)
MWRPRRRAEAAQTQATTTEREPAVDQDFDGSLEQLWAEIERLTRANAADPSRETERRLVRLRHIAGMRLVDEASPEVQFVAPDSDRLPSADPLPEITASELTPGLLRAGILRDGCLLVRGLVPREGALELAQRIDRAFDQRERHDPGRRIAEGFYEEFRPHSRYGDVVGRTWIQQGGGLLAADAPMLSFEMMEIFRAARLRELVTGYLGEPALISVHKTTLRKADPSVPGAWHQDGFFMGEVRSLNLWLSLSRCGDESPGLDILPRRLENYVATATDEAVLDYTISQQKVQETAGDTPVIRPIFEPGDALFFDELFLHQTGSDPAMRKPRYAVENWFFGGSGFPGEYAPIAV